MKNYTVNIQLTTAGKLRDEWHGVASTEDNAKAAAITAMAKKYSVKESEVTVTGSHQVRA